MTEKIITLAKEILEEIKALKEKAKLSASVKNLESKVVYFLRREGVAEGRKRTEGRPASKLAKTFFQAGRESSIFRGTLEEAIKKREEALADPKKLEEQLREETEAEEALAEAAEEDSQVLATSEQKPKKKRGRKPKAKPEEGAEGESED